MNNRWNRFLSLLLALCTVLTMIPAAFALETTEALPEETETGVEEAAADEEPAQEPAVIEDAAEEAADVAETGANEPMAIAVEELPVTSETEYARFSYSGAYNYAAADELRKLINQELPSTAASYLTMSSVGLDSAMEMAAESVFGTDAARPNGEDWLTIAGDNGLMIDTSSYSLELFVTEEATADAALEALISSGSSALSGEYKYVGVGSFTLSEGHTYWVLFLFNAGYEEGASIPADTDITVELPYDVAAWTGALQFGLTSNSISMGATVNAGVTLTNGVDTLTPSDAQLVYSTSDEEILTVSASGDIKAVAAGTASVGVQLTNANASAISVTLTSALNLTTPKLRSVSNIDKGIFVSWNAVPGATHYWICRKLKATSTFDTVNGRVAVLTSASTSWVDTSAIAGNTYYYTVVAVNVSNSSTTTSTYDTDGLGVCRLATPALSSASAGANGITFTWKSVTGASGYTVWRKTATTGWTKIGTVGSSSTSFVDSNVTKGTKYIYTVRAYNGSSVSNFVAAGKSATATKTIAFNTYTVTTNVYYRTGAGTSYKAAGTLKAGTQVNIVAGWSKTANNATWYKFNLNGKIYYVMAKYLLKTPVLKSASNAAAGIQVNWNKVNNASGYTVWRKTATTGWSKIATISSGNTTSYIDPDKNLTTGNTYIYTVRATKGSVSSWFQESGVSRQYIKTPSLISTVIGDKKITFTWNPVDGADGYKVWRRVDNGSWTLVSTITDPTVVSYVDTDVTSMVQYTYTVRATLGTQVSYFVSPGLVNVIIPDNTLTDVIVTANTSYRTGAGTGYGVSGTFKAGTRIQVVASELNSTSTSWCRVLISGTVGNYWRYVPKSSLLKTPVLKATAIRANGISLTWNQVSNASGYEVWRKTGTGSWQKRATITSGSTTSYLDTSVASGTSYTYTVRATANSYRSWFDETGLTTTFLAVPSLVSATPSNSGIKVTWGMVDGAKGYYVYRKPAGGGWSRIKIINSGSTVSYLDDGINGDGQKIGLIKDTTYIYAVRAFYTSSIYSYYDTAGISATAIKTLNPATVKYEVTANNTSYYTLINGQVVSSGKKGTFSKGDIVYVIPDSAVVEDSYTDGLTYTPILVDNVTYYIATNRIEKV